jgi:rfaE bifunctional protein kinase chain/domain
LKKYTSLQLKSIFTKINHLKVFVVGDAMLDNYWMGDIDRISPEAPVPVLTVNKKESRPGGAANVALNCKSLGAEVYLLTMLGNDDGGKTLINQLNNQAIRTDFCIKSKERVTTSKTRVLSKNQQIIRIDEEKTDELSVKDEHHFIDTCLRAIQIEKPDVLIFEDYNKGLLKKNVIEKIITHCKHVGVITAVDPKLNNFLSYKGIDIFKPNLKEIKEALNLKVDTITLSTLKEMHKKLNLALDNDISMITLSEKGIFIQQGKEAHLIPAHIRRIADVSGAGDTVIAVAALIYTVTKNSFLSAKISNLAGGLVCEQVGVVPIDKKLLIDEFIKTNR